ncbi:MAG TPA: GNAT family N-acetyltransferase [Thermoplasmata archaeon]
MTQQHPSRHRGNLEADRRLVSWEADLETARSLFHDYRNWLAEHRDPDPGAQARGDQGLATIDELIAQLPGAYGPPSGDVLLWTRGESVVACGAIRQLDAKVGEIKRISVRPDFRGKEFGAIFVAAMIDRARELGYEQLKVDTLPSMTSAIEFYQEAGFKPAPPYWPNPAAGAVYFERTL